MAYVEPQSTAKINRKVLSVKEENAAQAEASNIIEGQDQTQEQVASENQTVESATAKEVKADDKPSDGFQTRINKVTAKVYAGQRREVELQKRIDDLEAANTVDTIKKPNIDDFDSDDDFSRADRNYEIQLGIKEALSSQDASRKQTQQKAEASLLFDSFDKQVTALKIDDFYEKAGTIPDLPDGVADAIMAETNGAEMIIHLSAHLDKADALAGMTPGAAMMELGRISAQMSAKQNIEPSAAPDPIEPLSSGGGLSAKRGPKGATFE